MEDEVAESHGEIPEDGGPISERAAEAGLDDERLVPIDPLPSSVEYRWMEEFAGTVTEPRGGEWRGQRPVDRQAGALVIAWRRRFWRPV